MTRLEAGVTENRIIARTGMLDAVVCLCSRASRIWHDWVKAIYTELAKAHPGSLAEVSDYVKTRENDYTAASGIGSVKVSALKRISIVFDILAETFRIIENSADQEAVHGDQK
jgi:hypothetical protein